MNEWFRSLSRPQVGLLGGVIGYFLGLVSGPVMRLIFALAFVIVFEFLGSSIGNKFESRLGFTGIIAAILAVASLGPIRSWMGAFLGDVFASVSRWALTIVGVYLALYLHQSAIDALEEEI